MMTAMGIGGRSGGFLVLALTCAIPAHGGVYTILHSFAGGSSDGAQPRGTLIQSGSILYATTSAGGPSGSGTLFQFNTSSNVVSLLANMPGNFGGSQPYDGPAQSGSVLYGLTSLAGSLYKYDLSNNTSTPLHALGTGGYGLPLVSGSSLYGLLYAGGTNNKGLLFQYNLTTSSYQVLYNFGASANDGMTPDGSLIQVGSNLYGMTSAGGAHGTGSIFRYDTTSHVENTLYSFDPSIIDGGQPQGSFVADPTGTILYGLTAFGGSTNNGTLFQYNIASGTETVLYNFRGRSSDGANPLGSLIQSGTTLYGLTQNGGTSPNFGGTIFQYDLVTHAESVLHNFGLSGDGENPGGSLLLSGTTLYGLTEYGGAHDDGTLFSFVLPEPSSSGTLLILTTFACRRPSRRAPRF